MKRFLDVFYPGLLTQAASGDFYIQGFAVDEDLRGQGIGSALMDAMEHRARASGSKRLILNVGTKNEGARRLYDRRGMTVEAGWPKLRCMPVVRNA